MELAADFHVRRQVADVLYRYCRGIDRKDFEVFRSAYHPDAYDDHGLYKGNVDGLIEWLSNRHQNIDQSMHFIGNMLIDLDLPQDRAFCESYCTITQRIRESGSAFDSASGRCIEIGCRYLDQLERRDGHWAFTRHIVVYEWWREGPLADVPLATECQVASRSREDPLYQEHRSAGIGEDPEHVRIG